MELPPYTRRAHAHALVLSAIMLGIDAERTDREVREDTGLDPDAVRAEITRGEFDEDALKYLAVFDAKTNGALSKVAAATIAASLLGLS